MKDIKEGIKTRFRFNRVVETGVPGFIGREKQRRRIIEASLPSPTRLVGSSSPRRERAVFAPELGYVTRQLGKIAGAGVQARCPLHVRMS